MKLLHFYCIESSERLQDGNLRMHKKDSTRTQRDRAGIVEKKAGQEYEKEAM